MACSLLRGPGTYGLPIKRPHAELMNGPDSSRRSWWRFQGWVGIRVLREKRRGAARPGRLWLILVGSYDDVVLPVRKGARPDWTRPALADPM